MDPEIFDYSNIGFDNFSMIDEEDVPDLDPTICNVRHENVRHENDEDMDWLTEILDNPNYDPNEIEAMKRHLERELGLRKPKCSKKKKNVSKPCSKKNCSRKHKPTIDGEFILDELSGLMVPVERPQSPHESQNLENYTSVNQSDSE